MLPVALAGQVLVPFLAHRGRLEDAFLAQARFVQQAFGPVTQRTAQPGVDGHRKALLGPLDELTRHVLVQHLPQQPLALAVAQLQRLRQPPGKLHHPVIQEGHAAFQRHAHRGPVHLHQDVVGHVGQRIQRHHLLHAIQPAQVGPVARHQRGRLPPVDHHRRRVGPVADKAQVQVLDGARAHDARPLVQLLAQVHVARARPRELARQLVPLRGRQQVNAPGQHPAQRQRQRPQTVPELGRHLIAVVAAEKLIAAIARQRHRHALARQLRHQEGGNLRRIGKGLVIERRQTRNDRLRLRRLHIQLGMFGLQVIGHRLGVHGLVVARLVKADGKGLHRLGRLRLHQRHDGGRIDAARQEGAQRHVGHHLLADGIAQQRVQLADGLIIGTLPGRGHASHRHLGQRPVRRGRRQTLCLQVRLGQREVVPGHELGNAPVDGIRCRHAVVAQQQAHRRTIHFAGEGRVLAQRLQLGTEQEGRLLPLHLPAVVERLLAQPVTRQRERPVLTVPQCQGKHAPRTLERLLDTPGLEGRQQRLGIGMPPPGGRPALLLQLGMQLGEVVDLAVEDQHPPARGRDHGLMACRRQIHDGEASMPQPHAHAIICPCPCVVRSAMMDGLSHLQQQVRRRTSLARFKISRNSAHL